MSNESNLQVTFSKRRSGLFKKVNEFCTLCGVDVALVVFSPSEKVFSFGHPNVDTIIDRYLSGVPRKTTAPWNSLRLTVAPKCVSSMLSWFKSTTHWTRRKGMVMSWAVCARRSRLNFGGLIQFDGMNRAQLELFKKILVELKKLVAHHVGKSAIQGASAQTFPFSVGNDLSSNIPLNYQPNPQQTQMFSPQIFHNPILQPHLIGFNNMGGGGYRLSRFYWSSRVIKFSFATLLVLYENP